MMRQIILSRVLSLAFMAVAVDAFSSASSLPHLVRRKMMPDDTDASLSSIRYRRADSDDKIPNMLKSFVSASDADQIFMIAEDIENNNRVVAWAKIQSLGYAAIPNNAAIEFEDDDNYNTNYYSTLQRREVVSSVSDMIESDVNEQLWEEFEDDPTSIPNGLASLPWTNEYRAASKAAAKRRERREALMEMEEQFAKRNRPRIWEMSLERASDQRCNNEGNRIELELVRKVLEEQAKLKYNDNDEVYVLSPLSLVPLFVQEQCGFVEVRQELIPSALSLKLTYRNMSAKLLRKEESLCLKWRRSEAIKI